MQRVAQNIKKFRELKNFTQEHVAEWLELSKSQYQRMETGQAKVDGALVDKVAKLFEVDTETLYTFDEKSVFQSGKNNAVYHHGDVNMHPIDTKLEKLYEKQIALLEEKIKALESEIKKLKGRPE